MIIRATFNDNDFTDSLERFFDNIAARLMALADKKREDARERYDEFLRLENLVFAEEILEESRDEVVSVIRDAILLFLKERRGIGDDMLSYLKDNLEVSIIGSVEDKWENGEVVYWFRNADKWITL